MLSKLIKDDIKKKEGGFTIVEVMIVLAIAGLILAIVFIAVPALQRNSRNTGRRADLGNLRAQFETWTSNNGGKLPSDSDVSHIGSIINGTGWGHYNGNLDLPQFVFLDSPTAAYCSDSAGNANQAACNAITGATWYPAATVTETTEYQIGYARDVGSTNLNSVILPARNEIHIFGEMECGTVDGVLDMGNDDDGVGAATYDITSATVGDIIESNARALAYVYQVEGEDRARCEDNT